MQKRYISAQALLSDSFELGLRIIESGFRPDFIVGIWRGGAPVGIAVQEVLEFCGIDSDHIAIRTSSYTGIGQRSQVRVHGLEYLERRLNPDHTLLLVDDVYDTGLSMQQVLIDLGAIYRNRMPTIRIAVPWFKPSHNATEREPDYYLHTTADWLVFPHELAGLREDELRADKPGIEAVRERLLALRKDR